LDPAGPHFAWEGAPDAVHLNKNDAKYVECIHTDGGVLGTVLPMGHVDFYANGGRQQPGCKLPTCDHSRAPKIFFDALKNCRYNFCTEWSCQNPKGALKNGWSCKPKKVKKCAKFGYDLDFTGRPEGLYYLKTTDHPPYCKKNAYQKY